MYHGRGHIEQPRGAIKENHMPTTRNHEGLHIIAHERQGYEDLVITSSRLPEESEQAAVLRAVQAVQSQGARIVAQEICCSQEAYDGLQQAMQAVLPAQRWSPMCLLDEDGGQPFCGTTIRAVRGREVQSIMSDGHCIGCWYDDTYARYCYLGDLRDRDLGHDPGRQTETVLAQMIDGLARAGLNFHDVVRTWFYNTDILAWYDDFNRVRTAFFNEHQVFDGLVPASTGIGAGNPMGSALIAGLVAMRPLGESARAQRVDSPLQCAAWDYGSSFSRAAVIVTPEHERLYVSGTASIEPGGDTVHIGEMDKQVDLTMRVVEAILAERNMAWRDVVRGLAYIRNPRDVAVFQDWLQANALAQMPMVLTNNVVCRDDLLFEIEVDAVRQLR